MKKLRVGAVFGTMVAWIVLGVAACVVGQTEILWAAALHLTLLAIAVPWALERNASDRVP